MPFYIRARARYPLWLPPVVGAGFILVVAATRGFSGEILTTILHFLLLAVLGAAIAGGFYWGYNVPVIRRSIPLRCLLSTLAVALFVAVFTLAITRSGGELQWDSIARSSFLVSTSLLSVLVGLVIGRDLFGLSPLADRIYLTPAEFSALPAAEQAQLKPEGS